MNWNIHCVKSVQIRRFFWSVFSRIRTEYGEISLRIQSECRKIRTIKNSVFGHISHSDLFREKVSKNVETPLASLKAYHRRVGLLYILLIRSIHFRLKTYQNSYQIVILRRIIAWLCKYFLSKKMYTRKRTLDFISLNHNCYDVYLEL